MGIISVLLKKVKAHNAQLSLEDQIFNKVCTICIFLSSTAIWITYFSNISTWPFLLCVIGAFIGVFVLWLSNYKNNTKLATLIGSIALYAITTSIWLIYNNTYNPIVMLFLTLNFILIIFYHSYILAFINFEKKAR